MKLEVCERCVCVFAAVCFALCVVTELAAVTPESRVWRLLVRPIRNYHSKTGCQRLYVQSKKKRGEGGERETTQIQ